MFRILSIDGGGIRGIIPAKILALLEEELGRRGMSTHIYDYFDMIIDEMKEEITSDTFTHPGRKGSNMTRTCPLSCFKNIFE